jgi:S1-C subfamily serine protease
MTRHDPGGKEPLATTIGPDHPLYGDIFAKTALVCSTNVVALELKDGGLVVKTDGSDETADLGHGVIVMNGTRILTASHNLSQARKVFVWKEEKYVSAEVTDVYVNARFDLAILEIDPELALPSFEITTSIRQGQSLISWGFGPKASKLTRIKQTGSAIIYYHTAWIVKGESGSPLCDREGRLVGVNTSRTASGRGKAVMLRDLLSVNPETP